MGERKAFRKVIAGVAALSTIVGMNAYTNDALQVRESNTYSVSTYNQGQYNPLAVVDNDRVEKFYTAEAGLARDITCVEGYEVGEGLNTWTGLTEKGCFEVTLNSDDK